MKSWKEITKLENETVIVIVCWIIIAVFSIITAFVVKNSVWAICGILSISIAVEEFCNNKIIKMKDATIDIQKDHIEMQHNLIMNLFKKLRDKTRTVKLADIKIPEYYKKPNKNKLKSRIQYYIKNKCFATPIIIDKETKMLIDGYTSYLIAKKYNFEIVQVEEV